MLQVMKKVHNSNSETVQKQINQYVKILKQTIDNVETVKQQMDSDTG